MSVRIIAKKVVSQNIAVNHSELNMGYRMKAVEDDSVDHDRLGDMIERLRKLAHSKENSAGTVNQTNREAAYTPSNRLSAALERIDIQFQTQLAIKENPLLSTMTVASNVLKFKRVSA